MTKIKFGTDGWRAIIAKDYTVENVVRVTEAVSKWLRNNNGESVVVGYDCRFGGQMFAEAVSKVLLSNNIKVYYSKSFVSTPMLSLGTLNLKADLGIVITASHNPPSYNGYKLKGSYGGPLLPDKVKEIEDMIPENAGVDLDAIELDLFKKSGQLELVDLETMYCDHVEQNFDLDAIRSSGMRFAYDAMYGSGQNVIKRLLPDVIRLHCDYNPSFMGQAPEPIHKNLQEFSKFIQIDGNIKCGLATDGDADRIGLYDDKGNFIDSHHIILLLIKYLCEEKRMTGKVVTAFSVTPRIKKMCDHFGLDYQVVKIGFKYVAGIMLEEDVLLGGEESGGIAIKGHIPERDGIWMGLVVWEYMAKSGKSLHELINDVYAITGSFAFERSDLHLDEKIKQDIIAKCEQNAFESFGRYKIDRLETIDGWKYYFNDNEWLMIRPSGTEPVLRTYAESSSREKAVAILNAAKNEMLKS